MLRYLLDTSTCIRDLIVVTNNTHEFSRVPGLRVEDWR